MASMIRKETPATNQTIDQVIDRIQHRAGTDGCPEIRGVLLDLACIVRDLSRCGTPESFAEGLQEAGRCKIQITAQESKLNKDLDNALKRLSQEADKANKLQAHCEFLAKGKAAMADDIAKALGHGDTDMVPWWSLVAQASKLNAQVERLIKDRDDVVSERNDLDAKLAKSLEIENLLRAELEDMAKDKAHAEELGNRADKALDRAIEDLDKAVAAHQRTMKLQETTQEQLDKFMSRCADQSVQIMELRAAKGIGLDVARDILKGLDVIDTRLSEMDLPSWKDALRRALELREILALAIRKADQ